jgi:hypothetical protein
MFPHSVHVFVYARGKDEEPMLRAFQRRPGGQIVHVVSPMDDLSVLDRDGRYEPVVVGRATREALAVYLVCT